MYGKCQRSGVRADIDAQNGEDGEDFCPHPLPYCLHWGRLYPSPCFHKGAVPSQEWGIGEMGKEEGETAVMPSLIDNQSIKLLSVTLGLVSFVLSYNVYNNVSKLEET